MSQTRTPNKRSPEELLAELTERFNVMEAERKQYISQAQVTRQRNKDIIEKLQKENKELKEQVKSQLNVGVDILTV